MVRTVGLEPMASTLATSCSAWLNYIRESNKMRVRSTQSEECATCMVATIPAGHQNVERKTGIEPVASSLEDSRSAS